KQREGIGIVLNGQRARPKDAAFPAQSLRAAPGGGRPTFFRSISRGIRVDSHEGLKQHMYVYRISDLQSLYCQMDQLWWDMFYFTVSNTRDCGIQQLLPIDCYPLC